MIDVSHHCDARSRKKVDAWLEKLANKFPLAADVLGSKVFVDAPEMEHDTLEELYRLCKSKQEFSLFLDIVSPPAIYGRFSLCKIFKTLGALCQLRSD